MPGNPWTEPHTISIHPSITVILVKLAPIVSCFANPDQPITSLPSNFKIHSLSLFIISDAALQCSSIHSPGASRLCPDQFSVPLHTAFLLRCDDITWGLIAKHSTFLYMALEPYKSWKEVNGMTHNLKSLHADKCTAFTVFYFSVCNFIQYLIPPKIRQWNKYRCVLSIDTTFCW